jgi:hypothetical protein
MLFFSKFFLGLLAKPYFDVQQQTHLPATLPALTLSEKFMVDMKTALLFGGLFFAWIFISSEFISAGLYRAREISFTLFSPVAHYFSRPRDVFPAGYAPLMFVS